MSKDAELRREMARLIGDPEVRKVVRYFELKEKLAERKRRRGQMALRFVIADSNWGDSCQ